MLKGLTAFLFLFSFSLHATDCKTDCSKHFDKWYQGLERARCFAEREIACKTGLTNCDTFKVGVLREGYFAVRTTIEKFNDQYNFPANPTACHQVVDKLSTGETIYGKAKQLGELMTASAKKSVSAGIASGIWTAAAKAGIEAVLDCGCRHANYKDRSDSDDETASESVPKYNVYAISLVRADGRYAIFHGSNTKQNRANLLKKTKDELGGQVDMKVTSAFSSKLRTLTEAICEEGTHWATRTGSESISEVLAEVKSRKWSKCRFRTMNHAEPSPDKVSDRYFASVLNKTGWGLRTGPIDEKERVLREALDKIRGNSTKRETGRFSTSRTTQTRVACEKEEDFGGGLGGSSAAIFMTSGQGYQSVQRALDITKEKYSGYTCSFDVKDFWFGPEEN